MNINYHQFVIGDVGAKTPTQVAISEARDPDVIREVTDHRHSLHYVPEGRRRSVEDGREGVGGTTLMCSRRKNQKEMSGRVRETRCPETI